MRVIRIFPVLAILTATVLVASLFAFSVVGSVDATLPDEPLEAITLTVARVDIVLTDDLANKGEVITVIDFDGSPISFNFLGLQDGVLTGLATLGTLDIPDGFVTQFRIITIDAEITFNGTTDPLQISAGVLRLNGVVSVPDEDAVFDFDVEKSVISTPAGFKLKSPIKFQST